MKEFTLTDSDVFSLPEYLDADTYQKRTTVKAIVKDDRGLYAFITNPVHDCVLLAGGGAESDDLIAEAMRECEEELGCEVKVLNQVGSACEYRNRNAIQYQTMCYAVVQVRDVAGDKRTEDEKENGLCVIWLSKDDVTKILDNQVKKVHAGEITFYNTAFNIIRDQKFWQMYTGHEIE